MDMIKESFDQLPNAVCFFDARGVIRLINHRMLAIADLLHKNGIQTLEELQHALDMPPAGVCCVDLKLRIYRFPNGRTLRFSKEQITTRAGIPYTQVTACDVTKLMQRQMELKEENEKLTKINERLRRLFEEMPEIVREEEMLSMKQRVHDDIGHSIIAARRIFHGQIGLKELKENAASFEQAITMLYRSNQIRTESDPLGSAINKASCIGVRVLTDGRIPTELKKQELAALAVSECAANCARHAGGTELYVHFFQIKKQEMLLLTNNGAPPKEEIREGSGLSILRYRVTEAGGKMEIQSIPRFKLLLILPGKENQDYENHDR